MQQHIYAMTIKWNILAVLLCIEIFDWQIIFYSFLPNPAFGFLSLHRLTTVSGNSGKNKIHTKLFCFQTHLAIHNVRPNTKLRFELLAKCKCPGKIFFCL